MAGIAVDTRNLGERPEGALEVRLRKTRKARETGGEVWAAPGFNSRAAIHSRRIIPVLASTKNRDP